MSIQTEICFMFYTHYAGKWVTSFFPRFTWRKETTEKVVYLTFDDGPVPQVTDFVLAQLAQYQAEATFFCVGDNINKYPTIFQKILAAGHQVGNHTQNHLNGWKNEDALFLENIAQCQTAMDNFLPPHHKKLFRPPYGKLTTKQADQLLTDYEIVMWTILSGDFDTLLDPQKCLEKTMEYTENGAIVVFHDSVKAAPNLYFVLPRYLEFLAREGYICKRL